MVEVRGHDCVGAWRAGVQHLLSAEHHRDTNLLLHVDRPTDLYGEWLSAYDPRRVLPGADHLADVINTVFPYRLRARFPSQRTNMYAHYLGLHKRARRYVRNRGAWGTYFQRLIAFDDSDRGNQLETVIEKLTTWNNRATAALVFHTSSPQLDSPRTRGGPCWHFGEIIWHGDNVLDLVVVYRNHDYFNKALGNLIALGQLLKFICDSAHKRPGKLICHSVHAYFEVSRAAMVSLADGSTR